MAVTGYQQPQANGTVKPAAAFGEPEQLPEPPPVNPLFDSLLADLRNQMTRATYDAHVAKLKPDGEPTRRWRLLCPQASKEWLEKRLRNTIEDTAKALGVTVPIEFKAV